MRSLELLIKKSLSCLENCAHQTPVLFSRRPSHLKSTFEITVYGLDVIQRVSEFYFLFSFEKRLRMYINQLRSRLKWVGRYVWWLRVSVGSGLLLSYWWVERRLSQSRLADAVDQRDGLVSGFTKKFRSTLGHATSLTVSLPKMQPKSLWI